MSFHRAIRRQQVAGISSALFMVGLYVGRLTIRWKWGDLVSTCLYLFNAGIWMWLVIHEARREDKRFREEMRQITREIEGR